MTEALNSPEDYQRFYEDMARRQQLLGAHAGKITIDDSELRGQPKAPSLNLGLFEDIMTRRGVDQAVARIANIPNDPETSIEEAFKGFAEDFDILLELHDFDQSTEYTFTGEPRVRQSAAINAKVERGDMTVTLNKGFYFLQPKDAVREVIFTLPRHIPWTVAMRARQSVTYGELEVAFASLPAEDGLSIGHYSKASGSHIDAMALVLDCMAARKKVSIIDQQRKIA
jgi:hypothetical protein